MAGFINLNNEGPFASAKPDPGRLEEEYQSSFDHWKATPTPRSRAALLKAVNPVIDAGLRSFGGASRESPTLRSRARVMALRAFDSYDPSLGSLRTHLMHQFRGLQRPAAQETQIIRLPERVALDKQHLDEAERELAYNLGRDPSNQQLADFTGLSLKRIAYIRQASPVLATGSVLDSASEDENFEMPASNIPGADPQAEGWEELVYYDLDDTDQFIMDHTLGRHGRQVWPLQQIAAKLGITPSAASQRAAKIQKLLDEQTEQELF